MPTDPDPELRAAGPDAGGDGRRDPFDATWRERLTVLGAAAGVLVLGVVLGLVFFHDQTLELLAIVPASMFVVGKFLPMWAVSGESNFTTWQLGLVIWVLDTYTVLFIVYALEGLYKWKRLKAWLEHVQSNAGLVLRAYPRIRKAAVAGVFCFVLFPIAGTGAMVGTFLGILLGLHRRLLIFVVSLGGLFGGMVMAFLATYFATSIQGVRETQQDPTLKYVTIGAVAVVVIVAVIWLTRAYRRALDEAEREARDLSQPRE